MSRQGRKPLLLSFEVRSLGASDVMLAVEVRSLDGDQECDSTVNLRTLVLVNGPCVGIAYSLILKVSKLKH